MSSHVKTEDQTVSKIAFVDIDAEAFEDPFRIDEDRARDLAASILANGLDNPITVARSGRGRNVAYGVTAGWHRHLAIQYIREGFEHGGVAYDAQPEFMNEVLVTVMDDVTEVNMLIRSVVENAHRRTPSQSEIAGVVARLLKAGMSKEDIAERLGRGVTAVSRAAKFHRDAAPALRALSVDGRIDNATAHHACALSEAAQVRVADAVHGGRDAREAVNARPSDRRRCARRGRRRHSCGVSSRAA